MTASVDLKPQPGPQEKFLSSPADIAIYGGAAGGGKTFALLLEPLRHMENKLFNAAIFRQTYTQVKNPGGLWPESEQMYYPLGAVPDLQNLKWKFPSGMTVSFNYMQREKDKLKYQGSQIPLIGFDELTHFSEGQFFYMLSRVRSKSGVPGYIRATTNPDPDSWVASFIDWWIDEQGYAIPERSGALRYMIRKNDEIIWGDSPEELHEKYGKACKPRSVTFINASLDDNPALEEADPDYRANLEMLSRVEKEQLLNGNWRIRPAAGLYFNESDFFYLGRADVPALAKVCRYWDRAATEPSPSNPDPDWTVGVLMGVDEGGRYYVIDVDRFRARPAEVRKRIRRVAERDGRDVEQVIEEDPGSAGVSEAESLVAALAGYKVRRCKPTGSKAKRAEPLSAQVSGGNVALVRADWNRAYTAELHAFDGSGEGHDDQVDASSGAFNKLTEKRSRFMIG